MNDVDKKVSVLFVDDEENVLRSLKRLAMDEDYEVLTALSGQEGLEVLKANELAVIVSDQRMPKMSGAEFLERAGELSPDTVKIILTGYADTAAAIDAINKGGAYRYVSKPWNDDDLLSTIRTAVERYRLIMENRYLTELTNRQNEQLKQWTAELAVDVQEQTIDLTRKNAELLELNEKLETNFRGFIITISSLIELRDRTVGTHSYTVSSLSRKISLRLGLDSAEIQETALAAQLHDIGKIGISDAVLLKEEEEMAPFELREYQTHSIRGQAAIDANQALRSAGVLIRHHHESWDGKGFPDRLKREAIPLGSRIIAVADRYDRLLATRDRRRALEGITSLAGIRFDPHIAHLLKEMMENGTDLAEYLSRAREAELHPEGLISGMVLTRDVRSGTGVLLLPRGNTLTPKKIDLILRYYRLDPPDTGVYVSVGTEESQ